MPEYLPLQRQLHWWVGAAVLLQFALQWWMHDAMQRIRQVEAASGVAIEDLEPAARTALQLAQSRAVWDFLVTTLHAGVGLAVALMVIYRLRLRRQNPVPVAAGRWTGVRAIAVRFLHLMLYAVLLMMTATGLADYLLQWGWAARWHELGKWALVALLAVHLLGVLWHVGVRRDDVLQRML